MCLLVTVLTVFIKVHMQMQFGGAAVVTAGVCTAAWPSQAGKGLLTQARLIIYTFHDSTPANPLPDFMSSDWSICSLS